MSDKPPVQGPLREGNNYPLHHAAYCCNIARVRQLLREDPYAGEEINPNSDDGTVLHSCARGGRENSHKVAEILLEALPSDSVRREIINKTDSSDKTALFYAVECSHKRLVEFLLSTGFLDPPEPNSEIKFSLTHLAVKNGSADVLNLLIEYGFQPCTFEDSQTPLHLCVHQPDSENAIECIKILVRVYSSKEINLRQKSDKKTALHLAAESCSINLLTVLLTHKNINLLLKDTNTKKIALDYAVESCKKKNSIECVRILMKTGTTQEGIIQRQLYCNTFSSGESELCPLDVAFQIRSPKMVETIVTELPDRKSWMEETDTSAKKYLTKMYEVTPEALPPLMTQCLTLSGDGSDVYADFGVIKGYSSDSTIETRYLRKVLNHKNKNTQKAVLLHPLVQLFLEGKQKKLNWLNVTSVIMQGIWLYLYTRIVANKYETYDLSSCEHNETNTILSDDCVSASPTSTTFVSLISVFIILTILVNLKEVAQLLNDGRLYFHETLNWLQIINLLVAIVVAIVGLIVRPPILFLVLAAFGFLMGCVLFLGGFATFDWCGIYIFAVGKVIPRTASLMLIFLPILIGFRQNLKILLPALKDQLAGNFQGVTKVLVVMTGEYDYNGIFEKSDREDFFALSGSVGFIVFLIIGFALLNTLTALTVDDISRLTKDARFRLAETRVKQIHHWEMFVSKVQKFSWVNWNLSRYLLLNDQRWRKDGDSTIILTSEKFVSIMGDVVVMDELVRE